MTTSTQAEPGKHLLWLDPSVFQAMVTRGQAKKEDKEPSWALALCSSLSREGSPPLGEHLSTLFIPIHPAQFSASSLLGAPSSAYVFTPGFPCAYPKPRVSFSKKVQQGSSFYQHLQTGLQHSAVSTTSTYFYHPNISEHLR